MRLIFNTVLFDKSKHWPMIEGWYEKRGFPSPIPRFLPPTGVVCSVEATPICAGFLYKTDAGIAVISNLISDKIVKKEIRDESLDYLISFMSLMAREAGFDMVNCATNLDGLMKRFTKLNFTETDSGVSHFTKLYIPS